MKDDENLKEQEDDVLDECKFDREPNYDYSTPIDNIKAVGEFVGDVRKIVKDSFKTSSKADKAKFLLIILPFFIGLAIGVVGVTFADIGQTLESERILTIGYILMGIGFGTAFLTVIITIIVQAIKDRIHR